MTCTTPAVRVFQPLPVDVCLDSDPSFARFCCKLSHSRFKLFTTSLVLLCGRMNSTQSILCTAPLRSEAGKHFSGNWILGDVRVCESHALVLH